MGTVSVNQNLCVYIIGFNHNGSKNIDFGTFKTDLVDGTSVALYLSGISSVSGQKNFNINHNGSILSLASGNHGGWKGCDLRYDVLGSTDKPPSNYGSIVSKGRVGYDASSNCATNPVADTLMAALPEDLRAVMKPMTIYTDNVGDDGNGSAESISPSIDYLPLLSVYEIKGETRNANAYEQNYQAQYSYYQLGNSAIKYGHNSKNTKISWWTRSTAFSSLLSSYWSYITSNGDPTSTYTAYFHGIAPIFRV